MTVKNKRVSYSQFSLYDKCPRSWYYSYVKKLKERTGSIHLVFGNAIHETVQEFLEVYYDKDKNTDDFDYISVFNDKMYKFAEDPQYFDYKTEEDYRNKVNGKKPYSDLDVENAYNDGCEILKEMLSASNRIKYFPKTYELVGNEIEINELVSKHVEFNGYLDIVLREKSTGNILIIDLKGSSAPGGWNKYMKVDDNKLNQLRLYKLFYAKKYDVSLNKIDVKFLVLKRKLIENYEFPQARVQVIPPSNGKGVVKEVWNKFKSFVSNSFNEGEYEHDIEKYPKISGPNKKNCKYCPYKKKRGQEHPLMICDGKGRIE